MTRIRDEDVQVAFVRASGPGGQHRNTRQTGVRLVHRPTGLTVTATERRSQAENRRLAFERLAEVLSRLQRRRRRKRRVPTRPSRAARERRLQAKKRHAAKKTSRRPVSDKD